ncbi:DegT/DnrJ/EryC1/StrS family aminotransferase [candidate division KSB1 bacterium]|nr:DegT/DnrJ/EryC1/StrS family aminotransferase [candidate division KSB1 bacterium]
MSRLALLGGEPVTKNILEQSQFKFFPELERKYLLKVHESRIWDDWPETESMASQFQKEWAAFNQSKFCALLTNGTHTLQVALETLDIGYGDEVIVPGITWQATASAVCDVNAIPVIVDVQPDTLCIDPDQVEAAITPRTRAIIPVHLYHRMADMDKLVSLAQKHQLHIIEDCAHTHGSRWDGNGAGTLGVFGSYSFQRSKLLNSAEGGALLMQNEENYWKVVSQRSCGREYQAGIKVHSGNYRLTSFQAAVLRGQLAALKVNAPLMNQNGLALDGAVSKATGVSPLRRHPHITQQCSYAFVFLYDKETFDGLDNPTFRKALSAELGFEFWTTYTPLSHSEVYYPHTKKRHQLNSEYLAAINPGRWELPVADDLWKNRVVLANWSILGCPPERAHLLTDAIIKIYENRDELLKYARTTK